MEELIAIVGNQEDVVWQEWLSNVMVSSAHDVWIVPATTLDETSVLPAKKVLIICDLNEIGRDSEIDRWILKLRKKANEDNVLPLEGYYFGLVTRSKSDWYTKTYARYLCLCLNALGADIIGKPLIEFLPNYVNLKTWQKRMNGSLEEVARQLIHQLIHKIIVTEHVRIYRPKILVLHASKEGISNTLSVWRMTEKALKKLSPQFIIKEIAIERGSITDCIGCPFDVCIELAKALSCTVGGQFVDEIMPALDEADAVVWLCPNYNDTIGADLSSVINRMSGFYRSRDLSQKRFYAIIISGNSGTDAVANQLVGALNLNKGFALAPNFCLTEIASEPLSVLEKEDLQLRVEGFASRIYAHICE